MSSPTAAPPRKFPPPCWTDDEAQALISVFKQKWTSLNRTNLKSHDWDDVAASLAAQFPLVSPSKTAVQCHNKIEKLRKRFRSEKLRASTRPGRFSPWALYPFMEDLESHNHPSAKSAVKPDAGSGFLAALDEFVGRGDDAHFPVKSLGNRNLGTYVTPKSHEEEEFNPKRKLKLASGSSVLRSSVKEVDPVGAIVSSIRLLGEKYMEVEKRKMEMAREIVMMQMDMEMKQTQAVMESQQQMVNVCVSALLDSKKKKRKIKAVPTDS
ncbi:hypothetical protein ACLB2K_052534 [Fragaria x ananassa]